MAGFQWRRGRKVSSPKKLFSSNSSVIRAGVIRILPGYIDSFLHLDSVTPKTIKKYTGHLNGAVYGSPQKIKDGKTPVGNVFICGTDQGFLGIIGASLSGISMANLHVLQK